MAERPEIGKTKQGKGENDVSRQKIMMRLRSKHKSKANATTSYSKKRSAEKNEQHLPLDKNLIFFVVSPFVAEASLILGEKEVTKRKFIMSTMCEPGGAPSGSPFDKLQLQTSSSRV
jgi:hypothetical protein